MPLLDDSLTIWKISFRWAGLDPDSIKYRFYIPHTVKDNMRLILNAVLTTSLYSNSLKQKALFKHATFIDQDNLTKLNNIISDWKYNREFLQTHSIYRSDFAHWCNRQSIPFPEFWFPKDWAIHELSQKDWALEENPELSNNIYAANKPKEIQNSTPSLNLEKDYWQPAIIAAKIIWSQDKTLSIADVIRKIKAMPDLKASFLTESAIRKHVKHLSPTPGKPGRKPSK